MKSGKRLLSLLLALVLLVGLLPPSTFTAYATETKTNDAPLDQDFLQNPSDGRNEAEISSTSQTPTAQADGGTPEVTRAQWLQALVKTFSMTVDADNYPDNYFSDLTGSEAYYRDILVAVEFGVIDLEAGLPFEPDQAATREFAAHTLNHCLGYQLQEDNYSFSEAESVTYPNDIQIAIERGWFGLTNGAFLPDQPITASEKDAMLADAVEVLASDVIDETYENSFEFSSEVIELPENTAAQLNSDTELAIANPKTPIKKGDIFAVYLDGFPMVYRAEAVTVSGTLYTVTVTALNINDYLLSADAQGVSDVDLADFEVAEGLDAIYILEDGTEVANARAAGTKEIKSLLFYREIKGYKFQIEVYNMKLNWRASGYSKETVDVYAVVTGKAYFSVSVPFGASVSDFSDLLSLGYVPIGMFGKVSVTANLSIDGSVTIDYGARFSAGVSYNARDGFRIPMTFEKTSFSLTVEATLDASVTASVGLTNIPMLSATCRATIGMKVNCTMRHRGSGSTPALCIHTDGWLYALAGAYATVGIKGFNAFSESYSNEIVIWDRNTSPVRSVTHFEDGTLVSKCSYGDTSFGGYSSGYYSSSGSKYANGGVSSVANSPTFTYTTDDDGNATVTGYSGAVSSLSIPATIDGHPVTAIGANAFSANKSLRTVTLPSGVLTIGSKAFYNCTNLKSITLPETLTTIGESAFQNCSSLVAVDIPDSVTSIGSNAFESCKALQRVDLSNSLESIGYNAFKDCSALTAIHFPKTLNKVDATADGQGSFRGCISLKTVTIEEGITAIPANLLRTCPGVEQIVLPDSVTSIGSNAFESCTVLHTVEMSNSLETIGYGAFKNCSALTAIHFPKTLNKVNNSPDGTGAFSGCTSLKTVTIEDGITAIPDNMLRDCPGVEELIIPRTVTTIGKNAFSGCVSLKTIAIPDTVTSIGDYAFRGCTSLTDVRLSNSLTKLEDDTFTNCSALTEITIPKSITACSGAIFGGCTSLKTVILEDGMTAIPANLCYNAVALESVVIPESVTAIGSRAFQNTGFTEFTIPDRIVKTGDHILADCLNLKKVTWTAGTATVPEYAFAGSVSLEEVVFPDTVDIFAKGVFRNCDSLVTVDLPEALTNISSEAFYGCDMLESITIPENVTKIEGAAFYNCDSLTRITIPEGVTTLGSNVFYDCDTLETVDIANSVTSMGTYVFYHNDVLTDVKLSQSLTKIPEGTFKECALLTEIAVPYFVTSVGSNAFNSSTSLTKVITHSNLSSIGSLAFSYPNVTVFYGDAGSYTETWATENGYAFHENTVATAKVTLSDSSVSIAKGKTYTLRMAVEPIDFGGTIAFKSSNDSVATVDASGKITAVAPGTATIKVTVGGVSASCKVTVTQAITRITLNKSSLSLNVPETYQLTATITPSDASNKVLKWTSSNASAATVDSNGLVKAVGNGTAVITATTTDGTNLSASCTVTVVDLGNIPVSSISLSKTSLTLDALDTYKLTATVSPTNAVNQKVVWSSSNNAVVTVDTNGQVTAVAKGTATITASAADGFGAKATCQITVSNTAYVVTDVAKLESSHDYANSCSDFWVYTLPGAEKLAVTFDDRTMVEDGFDYLKIYDGSKNLVGTYTGAELAGQTIRVPGNTVRIQLQSDNSGTEWGFKVTSVTAEGQIKINAPTVKASNVASTGKIKLSWNAVEGAVKYELYRSTSENGEYTLLTTTANTSATNTKTDAGKTYYYKVVAIAEDGTRSTDSNIASCTCDLPQPVVTLGNVQSSGKIKVMWDAIEGAVKYKVYYSTSKTGTYTALKTTTGTSLTHASAVAGKTYYYKVIALAENSAANSAFSAIKSLTCKLAQPTVTLGNVQSSGKIKIMWDAVEGAVKYKVYYSTSKTGTYKALKTLTGTSLTHASAEAGKTYYYKVIALAETSEANSAFSAIKSLTCDLARPTVSIALSANKPKVSWAKVDGAVSYKIYRATSKTGTYSLVKTTTAAYYKDTKAVAGKTYYYKVMAVCSNTSGNSAYSGIVSIKSK